MKAKTSDRKFDPGEKVVDQLDLSKARRCCQMLASAEIARTGRSTPTIRVLDVFVSDAIFSTESSIP